MTYITKCDFFMELLELYEKTIHKWKKIRNIAEFRNDAHPCSFCKDTLRMIGDRLETNCYLCKIDARLCDCSIAGVFGELDALAFNNEDELFKNTLKQGKKLLKRIYRKLYWKRYLDKYGWKGK